MSINLIGIGMLPGRRPGAGRSISPKGGRDRGRMLPLSHKMKNKIFKILIIKGLRGILGLFWGNGGKLTLRAGEG